MALSGFLPSFGSDFLICGDIFIHLFNFNNVLQCCNLVQGVTGTTHILGHTLDVLLTRGELDFVQNIRVGDFISDHDVVSCMLDFCHPATISE